MKLAQNVTRIAAAAYASAIALLVIWGAWLLLTRDPDGGRHPVGGAMLIAALVFTLLGLLALRRPLRRRRSSLNRQS